MPTKSQKKFSDKLKDISACEEARAWCGDRTGQQAWDECENPEWLFWLLSTTMPEKASLSVRRKIVRLACDCVRPVLQYVPAGETRPKEAIDLAEKWAVGKDKVSVDELEAASAASDAASAASDAASRAASDAASDAASWAASAASAASRAASRAASDAVSWAASAASRAASAASDAASDAASRAASDAVSDAVSWAASAASAASRAASRAAQCKLIRKYFPKCPTF